MNLISQTLGGVGLCANFVFGNPAPGVVESCQVAAAASPAASPASSPAPAPVPSPAPAPAPAPAPRARDVVDSTGAVIPSAYVAMAAQMSKDAGISYRYGPDAIAYGTANTGPDLYKRTDTRLTAPAKIVPAWWQVGGPVSGDAGLYSSNQANALFVADDTTSNVGVADLQTTTYMYNVFFQMPQLSWTRAIIPGGGMDSVNVMYYRRTGVVSGNPIATSRCTGRSGFCNEGLVAFQNGVIATVGSNTATNLATAQLAAHKVPTAIAMTNNSEFALVTVWDTALLKGQVAVIALAGLCDGCDPFNPAAHSSNGVDYQAWHEWWSEWQGVYPGLPNMGNTAFMKILGYIDLPGMAAPTEIAVTTGQDQFQSVAPNGLFVGAANSPLPSHWQSFAAGGGQYGTYAKGGVAVVLSKSENKVAFIDLEPLYTYINGMYFSASIDTLYPATRRQFGTVGPAPTQWPYTFDKWPAGTPLPRMVKSVSLTRPTAVKTTIFGSRPRAWVATQDGKLHIFALDGFAPGNRVMKGNPNALVEVGTVAGIGRNPTGMATSKGEPSGWNGEPLNQQLIVASRGDNKISWVRFDASGNSGSIVRVIRHKLLTDLVSVEDADNFSNAANVVTVTDYAGKAIRSYRYGPVTFTDGGACPAPAGCPIVRINGAAAEYGGAMSVPGKPFQLTSSNVP